MKSLIIKSLLLFLSTGLFFSCKKEKNTEPEQETITTKNIGEGIIETYQRQPNGTSVVFSNWIQKTQPDWMQWGPAKWTTDMNTTSLTDAVRDQGLVLVYFNFNNYLSQLPHTGLGENLLLDYHFQTGIITARYTYGGGTVAGDILNIKLRYILIPSSSFSGSGKMMSSPVDYNDYNAVCEYYKIPK
jgi:hypothetical protein